MGGGGRGGTLIEACVCVYGRGKDGRMDGGREGERKEEEESKVLSRAPLD